MEPLAEGDPQFVAGYMLLGELGGGGMGRVFLARTPDGRSVALKIVNEGLARDAQFRRRFRQEVAAAKRVSSPRTAAVIDADPDGTPPWMVTEYVAGPTLQAFVEERGPLPASAVLNLVDEIALALEEIHAAGVIHRDVKPTNVMMSADGPRIIDFGVARAADASGLTGTGLVSGSAGYMSPEQAMSQPVGPASDVFSLGGLAYFAATGLVPFGTGPAPTIMYRVVHEQTDWSAVQNEGLQRLIMACLDKSPGQRPRPAQVRTACAAVQAGGGRSLGRIGTALDSAGLDQETQLSHAAPAPLPSTAAGSGGGRFAGAVRPLAAALAVLMVSAVAGAIWIGAGRRGSTDQRRATAGASARTGPTTTSTTGAALPTSRGTAASPGAVTPTTKAGPGENSSTIVAAGAGPASPAANAGISTRPRSVRSTAEPAATAPKITNSSLPDATVGRAYAAAFKATGSGPFRWTLLSGRLPSHLALNSDGTITGTPSSAYAGNFTIRVTDHSGLVATAARSLTAVALVGDLDSDGQVDCTDYSIFLAAYDSGGSQDDLNGDGVVNAADLSLMAGAMRSAGAGTCA